MVIESDAIVRIKRLHCDKCNEVMILNKSMVANNQKYEYKCECGKTESSDIKYPSIVLIDSRGENYEIFL